MPILSRGQIGDLTQELASVFNVFTLNTLVQTRIDAMGLSRYTSPYKDLVTQASDLVASAEAEDFTATLVQAAAELRPRSRLFLRLVDDLGVSALGSQPATRHELEKVVRTKNAFQDLYLFRMRLAELEGQICRLEIPVKRRGSTAGGTASGTGFLIGPDLVLTNYHVIAPLCSGGDSAWTGSASETKVIFDFKKLSRDEIYPGVTYNLASDWLLDQSPPGASDDPSLDELDYAVIRLERRAGSDRVADWNPGTEAPVRGWLSLSADTYAFEPGSPLTIIQYPSGLPIVIAYDTDSIIGLNKTGSRVRYKTNTEKGSSGSPCFSLQLQLVALHHAGDPAYGSPQFNAGVPISAISARLAAKEIALT